MLNRIIVESKTPLRQVKHFFREQVVERLELRKLRQSLNQEVPALDNLNRKPLQILFNTQYSSFYVWIEYIMAHRLRERGHKPKFLFCDGLPYCEQETITFHRPSCKACYARSKRLAQAFSVDYQPLSEFLTQECREEANQISCHEPIEKLRSFKSLGVEIGEISFRNMVHYYKGTFPIEGKFEKQYRIIFESAYLTLKATENYFKRNKVDTLVSTNGKFIQSGVGVEFAENFKTDYVTWEVINQISGAVFARNRISLEFRIDEEWEKDKDIPLLGEQRAKIIRNFDDQSKSKGLLFRLIEPHYESNRDQILKRLDLDRNNPIVAMFPNVEWDSTAMIPSGFSSMLDWLCSGIDYAVEHPDYQFIIRAHPGESKVPYDLKTRAPICDRLRKIYTDMPINVKLVGPEEEVSSYAIGEMANVVMVFSSTLGLEFSLRSLKPWVAARTYYSAKGFTEDLLSRDDMYERLDRKEFDIKLTPTELSYAERFAYMIRYRYYFSFPFSNNKGFDFELYIASQNKTHEVIENVCDLVDSERSCLDLGKANW